MARAKVFIFQFVQKNCAIKPEIVIFVNLNKSESTISLTHRSTFGISARETNPPKPFAKQLNNVSS
jgi:hypothetical protein